MASTTADTNVDPVATPTPAALIPAPPALIRYDAACRAVAVARTVDDVQEIAAHAEAIRAYARQAKNRQLELDAAEIRIRAERRLGELMAAQRASVGTARPPGANQHQDRVAPKPEAPPTLAEAGIDKNLAHRARALAAVPEEQFEELLDEKRRRKNRRVVLPEVVAKAVVASGHIEVPRDDRAALGGLEGVGAQNAALLRLIESLKQRVAARSSARTARSRNV